MFQGGLPGIAQGNEFAVILIFCLCLLAGMILSIELGRKLGMRARSAQGSKPGIGGTDAAVFGLMGLLLAFTFSGAATRWEWRRGLIVDEANAIGTAYLRLDLLPASFQPSLRDSFQRYLRSRLAAYEKMPDFDAAQRELEHSQELQMEIWRVAVNATRETNSPAVTTLVLTPLNQMIDISNTRTAALQAHLPLGVFLMLAVTALVASLLAGYNMDERRSPVHIISFVLLVGITVYLIVELEYPRVGFVGLENADQVLYQTLQRMN